MAHALRRILHCAVDGKKHLFAMVSRNPRHWSGGDILPCLCHCQERSSKQYTHRLSLAVHIYSVQEFVCNNLFHG